MNEEDYIPTWKRPGGGCGCAALQKAAETAKAVTAELAADKAAEAETREKDKRK
jgi:hypothetical protein